MDEEDLFKYSTIEIPTVVGLLKNVLTQYPDNGQILKELVQNAEDAGASAFELVHDTREKRNGCSEFVQRFVEGPALFVYNDAEFTKEDWHGIRMLSESIKKEDLLKVGQFGLGFKSVFHFTDFVTIISGKNVLFMDPNEPGKRMCRDIPLEKLHLAVPVQECLNLWGMHLRKEHLNNGHFPGSIFWFPLRREESKISSTIYKQANVERLFKSFGVEAPHCLTFLKSLESISIRKVDECTSVNVLKVSLNQANLSEARKKRRKFKEKLNECKGFPTESLTCKYDIIIDTQCGHGSGIPEQVTGNHQRYRILHYLPYTPEDERSKHMPLVGVAAPISPVERDSRGQIFCFLPLPLESVNKTNLPLQVNGYFVLDQNRRHVKWRTEESSAEPDVLWNESLVRDVLSTAYAYLLHDLHASVISDEVPIESWYNLLPNIVPSTDSVTAGRWEDLSQKVWDKILQHPVIYSEVRKEMMYPRDVFSTKSLALSGREIAESVKAVLTDVGQPLATIPRNVEETLCAVGAQPRSVTPKLVRKCLKNNPMEKQWKREHLLEYVLSDGIYEDMIGIELLPLENGDWSVFSEDGRSVYKCSEEEAATFVGAEDRVLSTSLKADLLVHLESLATQGSTVLKKFLPHEHVTKLLRVSASHMQQHQHVHKELKIWLTRVWSLLIHVRLQEVENLPLIPSVENFTASDLISLSSAIIIKDGSCQVSESCIEALEILGIKVVHGQPRYVFHPDLGHYFNRLDGQGVISALATVIKRQENVSHIVYNFNAVRTEEQRQAFCRLIGEVSITDAAVKKFLKSLLVFKAVERNTTKDVSVEYLQKVYPAVNDFPVGSPELLIKADMLRLALLLDCRQISKEELCRMALEKAVEGKYSEKDVEQLGWYILNEKFLHRSESICTLLKEVKFVTTLLGRCCSVQQLYSVLDDDIDALLGEDLTLDRKYTNHNEFLKSLGLKAVSDMPRLELVRVVKGVANKQLAENDKIRKSKALLNVINSRNDCPEICQEVMKVKFVCGESTKPHWYPSSLHWASRNDLYKPSEVKSYHNFVYTLGSCIPLIDCEQVTYLSECFGWNKEPCIEEIIKHVYNVIAVCPPLTEVPGSSYYEYLKKLYQQLKGMRRGSILSEFSRIPFVFTRNGFKMPTEVYIPSGQEDLQLLPYMHALPFELCENKDLFSALGAFQEQSLPLFLRVLLQIQRNHLSKGTVDSQHDIRVVINILEKLVDFRDEIDPRQLLLPVETDGERLEFHEVSHCAYSDQECNWLDDVDLGVRIVHKSISTRLAIDLGVKPLNRHLLADEEAVMDWEQHEPLTTRIHNLLRQYRDGVAVLKELIQNADDAGATKICFLYDARQNEDSRCRLITDQYKGFQGAALWAYNNATFTESDFKNLCKLGGGTKELKSTKIGKFGLGFCSVYNLTDVPSFISGNNYIIFDPHQRCLGGQKGGVRYNFAKKMNKLMLRKLHGQFQPFENIFGCQIQEELNFDGTLFRFPLRTAAQAEASQICNQSYSHKEMLELLAMFRQIVGEVILFTQHVKEVKVLYIDKDGSPKDMKLLYESCRDEHPLDDTEEEVGSQSTQVERVAELYDCNHNWCGQVFQENTIAEVKVLSSRKGAQLLSVEEELQLQSWLISWHSGTGESCKLAQKLGGRVLSLASVAVPVERNSCYLKPKKLKRLSFGFYTESHVHCFLPLPVKTALPVQVNGYFEVASDRTSLLTRTDDDRSVSLDWNTVMMKDAVSAAYLNLLFALKSKGLWKKSVYFSLWPDRSQMHESLFLQLAEVFYEKVEKEDLEVFRNQNGWQSLSRCYFLSDSFYKSREIGLIVFKFMGQLLTKLNREMMELPQRMLACFGDNAKNLVIEEEDFYINYFVPHIEQNYVEQDERNKLLLHMIDSQNQKYMNVLKGVRCIPTITQGKMKRPDELIDPESKCANLYSSSDEVFPTPEFITGHRNYVLQKLGMKTQKLDTEMLVERIRTVDCMPCNDCAKERSTRIMSYLEWQGTQANDIAVTIRDVPFIPVKLKPKGWLIKWKGDECCPKKSTACKEHEIRSISVLSFASPKSVCSPELFKLAGSVHVIHGCVEGDKYSSSQMKVCKTLGIITSVTELNVESVVLQLDEYCLHKDGLEPKMVERICNDVYNYLNYQAHIKHEDLSSLKEKKMLLTKYGFVEPTCFAIDEDEDCAPHLFSAKREGLSQFKHMMESLGVPKHFSGRALYNIIKKKEEEFQVVQLPESEVVLISKLLQILFQRRGELCEDLLVSNLCLPDSRGIMCPISELCIDDGVPILDGEERELKYVNDKLCFSREMLKWLGVEERRVRRYLDSSNRLRFGQKEPLTTRLKNILDNYPCDTGIMKELLQNADDAGATEIKYILDKRTLPSEKLFHEEWAPLQGPALCVFNNSGFTKEDLEGIQNLGDSCKVKDPTSTGQYGIGFNAVYHLTDAPSFITRGSDIPENETLCMFDPHCKYDPHATNEFPGVQLRNLPYLRKAHPDSFKGYLEHLFTGDEGTMFRLPLRTWQESKIGEVMRLWTVEELLKEFREEMKISLLFLRHIRRISVCNVEDDGQLSIDYQVESKVSGDDDEKLKLLKECSRERNRLIRDNNRRAFLDGQRIFYQLVVRDSKNEENHWLVGHQFGTLNSSSLPELVVEAFEDRCLKLLPQSGVAVLLPSSKQVNDGLFRNFCYLPLPVQSGFSLCLNGHFALDNSRRNLWTGSCDFKGKWNEWLMEHVLAPVIAEALNLYRERVFSESEEVTLKEYNLTIKKYHELLPSCKNAKDEKWKKLVTWIYKYVESEELPLFDVFIPGRDLSKKVSKSVFGQVSSLAGRLAGINTEVKGRLTWCSLRTSDAAFPMYFDSQSNEVSILNTLKRLGMKLGSDHVYRILNEAGIKVDVLSPEGVVAFLSSWNHNCSDRCRPNLLSDVCETPFSSVQNVCELFKYVVSDENIVCRLNSIPLLVTSDNILRVFDEKSPVYVTKNTNLLPKFMHQFTDIQLVKVMKELKFPVDNTKFLKYFTLEEFASKLPQVLGERYRTPEARIPLEENVEWLGNVWKYIIDEVKGKFHNKGGNTMFSVVDCNWKEGKRYLMKALGNWALYPIELSGNKYVVPLIDAFLVLYVRLEDPEVYSQLPVPHPWYLTNEGSLVIIPESLELTATLKNPMAVLDVLYHCKDKLATMMAKTNEVNLREVVEYFGRHCIQNQLSISKLKSLKIYKDVVGRTCTLENYFIVPMTSVTCISGLHRLGLLTNTVILKYGTRYENDLFKYLKSDSVVCDLDLYTKFILPHLSLLSESMIIELLEYLRNSLNQLHYKEVKRWSQEEQLVVAQLKRTPFIMWNGTLVTAGCFYDSYHPVFAIMKTQNIPKNWRGGKWRHFLRLAGLVDKLSTEMFIEFARNLSVKDENVLMKSETLVEHLFSNVEELKLQISEIRDIEFLVPQERPKLEKLFPSVKTKSGLISFSSSAPGYYANMLWTTMSLLPDYALPRKRIVELCIIEQVPSEKLFLHICNICSISQASGKDLEVVMDSIYDHLDNVTDRSFLQRFAQEQIPVVHMNDKQKFVTVDIVVQQCSEEIEPYLYHAPLRYGRYFNLLEKLGISKEATCDHYVLVLNNIYERSGGNQLHPEESKCMKLAMEKLANTMHGLNKLKAQVLYLPTKDDNLSKSTEMYVADNNMYERVAKKKLDKPLFVGFGALKIDRSVWDFVQNLPVKLKPTFLSEVIEEEFSEYEVEEVEVEEITTFIFSEAFKKGILRLVKHFKCKGNNTLDQSECDEIQRNLSSVEVKGMKKIKIVLKLQGREIGTRNRMYFVRGNPIASKAAVTLFITKSTPLSLIKQGLVEIYCRLFSVEDCTFLVRIQGVIGCLPKPREIHKYLDEMDIRDFGEQENANEFYQTDVGVYLRPEFIPLLDNKICRFHEGEIVAMKMYIEGEVESKEDAIYIIVQIKHLCKTSEIDVMFDEYEVLTGEAEDLVVKSHQLYKFIRETDNKQQHVNQSTSDNKQHVNQSTSGGVVPSEATNSLREEELSEPEIMKKVREEVKTIWRSENEYERRHLLRRLYLKWHPDKNTNRQELYTRVMQYIQSLVKRLENGETIPDDDDHTSSAGEPPSDFYRNAFRTPPPTFRFTGGSRRGHFQKKYGSFSSSREKTKMSDRPKARTWMKQAQYDYSQASQYLDRSPCWTVYMCYKAAEKALKAVLYLEDCEMGANVHSCSQSHNLSAIASHISSSSVWRSLISAIGQCAGSYNNMQYPSHLGPPCERYTTNDAKFMLEKTGNLLDEIIKKFFN